MIFDQLFDDTQEEPTRDVVLRLPRTPATAERYAFLRTKRVGDCWQEGEAMYRKGPTGSTVFVFGHVGTLYSVSSEQ